jgi:hypothetical protein
VRSGYKVRSVSNIRLGLRRELRRPSANPTIILKEAAASYRVDTDAIATKVRQEFAAKEKAKKATQPTSSAQRKQPRANHPRGGEP